LYAKYRRKNKKSKKKFVFVDFYYIIFLPTLERRCEMVSFNVQGKKISVHGDGQVFVNGKDTGLKQWSSDPKRWSNLFGSEQKDLRGLSLEEVLRFKGYI